MELLVTECLRLLDLFCGAGGAAMGYCRAGFSPYGVDISAKPLEYYPFPHLCEDALEAINRLLSGEELTFSNGEALRLEDFAAIHASPPCQGYSVMNNLPWIRNRAYPLLILPTRECLARSGLPYVIENVAGARYGAKGLAKRGIADHGMKAAWLCGGMFGLPIYRHRYFETPFFWPQPGHPKHIRTRQPESTFSPRLRGAWEKEYKAAHPGASAHAANARDYKGSWDRYKHTNPMGSASGKAGLNLAPGYEKVPFSLIGMLKGNGAQANGVGVGHAVGWRVAAEAMGIDWMRREELTQAIPPVMTEYIGSHLAQVIRGSWVSRRYS